MKKTLFLFFFLFHTAINAVPTGSFHDYFPDDIRINQNKEIIFSEETTTNSIKLHIENNKLRAKKYYNSTWNETSIEPRSVVYIASLDELLAECPITQNTKIIVPNKVFISTDTFINPFTLLIPPGVTPKILAAGVITQGVWVYFGNGNCIESTNFGGLLMEQVIFSGISGFDQTLFDLTGYEESVICKFSTAIFTDFDHTGQVSSINVSWNDFQLNNAKTGIVFKNINDVSLNNIGNYSWKNENATYYDFRGNFGTIKFDSCSINIPSKNSFIYISPTSNFNSMIISNNNFTLDEPLLGGSIFATGSLDQKYPKIRTLGNAVLADSTIALSLITTGNSDYTTIAASDTPVTMNIQSLVIHTDEERLVVSTANNTVKVTYIGLEDARIGVGIKADVNVGIAAQKLLAVYIAKNDEVIETSEKKDRVLNVPITISTDTKVNLSTNDYLTFYVENETDTQDILVSKLIITI